MKLLVTGNIGYITTEFIEEAFPECQILLLGETEQKSNRRKGLSVHPMPKTEEEFKDIFKTYEFEGVIYFSNYHLCRRCMVFYPLFVFIHLLVSTMDQLRQILFLCICPGVSHCNRDRNVTLFIGKFNLRSDLPYDLFRFFGCLVFQDDHELITADPSLFPFL